MKELPAGNKKTIKLKPFMNHRNPVLALLSQESESAQAPALVPLAQGADVFLVLLSHEGWAEPWRGHLHLVCLQFNTAGALLTQVHPAG